jgi:hypothetical protein
MSDGWSRLRIFKNDGTLIDEYDAPTKRSWVLNGVGRCEFTVPVYDPTASGRFNPKLTQTNFGYGNMVLIDHKPSLNADNTTNGLLPPWVGIILPPQTWDYGKVKFTAYSAEQILKYRPLGNAGLRGVPGGIFLQLIQGANFWTTGYAGAIGGGISILPGNVDLSGHDTPITAKTTVLDAITQYALQTGYDWDITPQVTSGNKLQLLANWYKKKGYDTGQVMSNLNLLNASPMYTEQGELYNTVYATNDANTLNTRVFSISQDVNALSQQGLLGIKQIFAGTQDAAQSVIQTMGDAYLANINNNNFVRTFAPTVLDVGNAFSYCNTGNTWIVQNNWCGFFNGGIGVNGTIRIISQEYDDMANQVRLAGALQ